MMCKVMQVPDNFWVMYCEPFFVERSGPGDAWGRPEMDYVDGVPTAAGDSSEVNAWIHSLQDDSDAFESGCVLCRCM